MTARGLIAALALLWPAAATFAAEPNPNLYFDSNAQFWGTPSRIVLPEYPPAMLRAGRTAQVDFKGQVSGPGVLENVEFVDTKPEDAPFVEAVREVLHLWRFYSSRSDDCLPTDHPSVNRVWFEIVEGKPRVSGSKPPDPPPRDPAKAARFKPLNYEAPQFPAVMIRRGVEAVVFARVAIGEDGQVKDVLPKAYSVTRDTSLAPFETSVGRTARAWTYPPEPGAGLRTACYEVVFRFAK